MVKEGLYIFPVRKNFNTEKNVERKKMFVCLFLFYAIATVFLVYHGSDMMYEMRRRKPVPTLLLTQGIFNLPHHIGMV